MYGLLDGVMIIRTKQHIKEWISRSDNYD
jgi:hypothetical protein